MKNDERDIPTEPYLKPLSRWQVAGYAFWFLLPSAVIMVVICLIRGCHP